MIPALEAKKLQAKDDGLPQTSDSHRVQQKHFQTKKECFAIQTALKPINPHLQRSKAFK